MTRRFRYFVLIASCTLLILVAVVCGSPWKQYRQKHLDHELRTALLADNTNAALVALDGGANAKSRFSDRLPPTFWQVLRAYFQRHPPAQASVGDDTEEDKRSALELALEMKQGHGDPVVVKALIEHGARDFDALNNDELPVLVWASSEGYTDLVKVLLDRGADVNVYDHEESDWGALYYARKFHHPDIVQMLLKVGAKR